MNHYRIINSAMRICFKGKTYSLSQVPNAMPFDSVAVAENESGVVVQLDDQAPVNLKPL